MILTNFIGAPLKVTHQDASQLDMTPALPKTARNCRELWKQPSLSPKPVSSHLSNSIYRIFHAASRKHTALVKSSHIDICANMVHWTNHSPVIVLLLSSLKTSHQFQEQLHPQRYELLNASHMLRMYSRSSKLQ